MILLAKQTLPYLYYIIINYNRCLKNINFNHFSVITSSYWNEPLYILHKLYKKFKKLYIFTLKNSSGYDEILMKTLKINAPYISSPLCYIFNKAFLAGKVLKKGDKKNCANFTVNFIYQGV
jgi:hypothetical protein